MTAGAASFKPKTERFDVDGVVVELVRMPPDLRRAYHGGPEPVMRSQWEVKVDGELRGYVAYPMGVGGPWTAYSLLPPSVRPWGFEFGYDDVVRAWEAPLEADGTYEKWSGRFAYLSIIDKNPYADRHADKFWQSREDIARAWPRLMAEGKAPQIADVEVAIENSRQAVAEKAAKQQADQERYARERAEREAKAKRDAEAAEERRRETLEGLESLRERLFMSMTNLELMALGRAIEQFGGKA